MSSFYLLSLRRCLWVHSQITGSIKCSFCDSLFYHKHAFQTTIFYVFSGEWGPTPPSSLYENVTCGRGKHQTSNMKTKREIQQEQRLWNGVSERASCHGTFHSHWLLNFFPFTSSYQQRRKHATSMSPKLK